jgi:hypothetical protein
LIRQSSFRVGVKTLGSNVKRHRKQSSDISGTRPDASESGSSTSRIDKIARLLSDLADLMRQEDLGKESLHHLRQLQMRIRFAKESPARATDPGPPLPTVAPTLWIGRANKTESPLDFIAREYAAWIGKGLSRAHLRRLDMTLYDALKHWLREHQMPRGFDLPTKSELIDRTLARNNRLSIEHTPEQKEKLRLREAARRREKRT